MSEHNNESLITDILGHLEEVGALAGRMRDKGLIDTEELVTHFDKPLDTIDAWLIHAKERIECQHDDIKIISTTFQGSMIEVVWVCQDCGMKMEGQLDMYDLWHHNTTPNEIQAEFERVKQ